jgi:probable rRNA maturation factor
VTVGARPAPRRTRRVRITNRCTEEEIDPRALTARFERILLALGSPPGELSVLVVDDAEMRALNRRHLKRDRTTNVLSFPQHDSGQPGSPMLGDVVLAPRTVARQALASGRDPKRERDLVLVHAVLHLLGYDHIGSRVERERMRAREREVLVALGHRA